jgi:Mce-associated membrane protein
VLGDYAIEEGMTMTNQTTGAPESIDAAVVRAEDSAVPKIEDAAADVRADDPVGPEPEDAATPADRGPTDAKPTHQHRSISIGVRTLAVGAVLAVLVGAVGTLAWLYIGARVQLDAQASESARNARAEKMSLDYAVNAATMDFKDIQPWKVKLVAGTSQQLNGKLSEAAKSMEQILVPLQWSSTAEPLVAKVRSKAGGVIIVDCFVRVQTKTVQAPDALQSTATYSITIDTNDNWLITDVGGVGSVVGSR